MLETLVYTISILMVFFVGIMVGRSMKNRELRGIIHGYQLQALRNQARLGFEE